MAGGEGGGAYRRQGAAVAGAVGASSWPSVLRRPKDGRALLRLPLAASRQVCAAASAARPLPLPRYPAVPMAVLLLLPTSERRGGLEVVGAAAAVAVACKSLRVWPNMTLTSG